MRGLRIAGVALAALVITTLGISATDTWQGASGSLLGSLIATDGGVCPVGMVEVPTARTFTCVDTYEASPSAECAVATPATARDTEQNLTNATCKAASTGATPWRYIGREQAMLACAQAGKRLPTAEEWYSFAIGTPMSACNVDGGSVAADDAYPECVSPNGVRNAVVMFGSGCAVT